MSYQNQNHDLLTEELKNPELLAEFKDIYKTDQADLQSLARIRTRLQNMPSAATITRTPIVLSTGNRTQKSKHFPHKTILKNEKSLFPLAQRLNKAIALLVAASIIGAFAITFAWFHHSNSVQNTSHPVQSSQDTSQQSPQLVPAENFVVVNPTTAWLQAAVRLPDGGKVPGPLLRSVDAGKTWHEVSLPQIRFDVGYSLYTLKDGKTAWLVDREAQETLYQTRNGGQTWQKMTLLPQGLSVNMLVFVDQEHGWFLGEHPKTQTQVLLATTDGGKTWQQLSAPSLLQTVVYASQIQFIDAQTGWLSTTTPSGDQIVSVTHTAGSSWNTLPVSEEIKAKGFLDLKFVSREHGYLFVNHFLKNPSKNDISYLYETNDGGQTWQNQIVEPSVPSNVTYPTYMNEQQIQVRYGNTVAIYTKQNGRWLQTSSHTQDKKLVQTSFASTTIGLGIIDYTTPPSELNLDGDELALAKTADSGATWTKVPLTISSQTVTPYTVAYVTNPGWSYSATDEETGSKTFSPAKQSSSGNIVHFTAKKWLVRFICTEPTTAHLTVNEKQFVAPGCNENPISMVVSFDTAQSIQTVKVDIQNEARWLVFLEACTNEKLCSNTH